VFSIIILFHVVACSTGNVQKNNDEPAVQIIEQQFFDSAELKKENSRFRVLEGTEGMVVSDDVIASEWGADILRKGGNAIDAAVGVAFTLAVTRPHFASLGGGGFLLFCPKPSKEGVSPCRFIDFRETAPQALTSERVRQETKKLFQDSTLSIGIPGIPAGLLLALEKFGTRSRKILLSRPIALALRGVNVSGYQSKAANKHWENMNSVAKNIFGCPHFEKSTSKRTSCPPGTKIKQTDLAKVLESILRDGKKGFYSGWVVDKIISGVNTDGGVLSAADFENYKAVLREPVTGFYKGLGVISAPPPSAGGTNLIQMLSWAEIASRGDNFKEGWASPRSIHTLAHAMGLAYADRAQLFGDPDFVHVPYLKLIRPAYFEKRWQETFIDKKINLPSDAGLDALAHEGENTTHFSVIDKEGNGVSVTLTINSAFGSGFVPAGTGIVMNNELDDFSIKPGVPNQFGLVGADANSLQPGKRPLSSMTPTIVRDKLGRVRIIIGAAGGPRITTSVFLSLVNRIQFGMALPDAVFSARFHNQWKPESLFVERFGFPELVINNLASYGYEIKSNDQIAVVHAIESFPEDSSVLGVPDIRGEGAGSF